LLEIIENHNLPDWVRACATYAAKKGDPAMLSNVEKVLILKSVAMFSHTPDNVLADVADLLEELDVSENETIFEKGDSGDSMYVILDGKVRVHDGERLLNYLGERDVFGEMALLDPEPRLASVTAVEATRLFRLDQAPFFELMSERPEVATGIIRVLTSHLRNRVRDIGQLNARIQELEVGSKA
jgi:CRP-like cAMP-binding protein